MSRKGKNLKSTKETKLPKVLCVVSFFPKGDTPKFTDSAPAVTCFVPQDAIVASSYGLPVVTSDQSFLDITRESIQKAMKSGGLAGLFDREGNSTLPYESKLILNTFLFQL